MARLHRTHPGQEAMVDGAQYLWWPTYANIADHAPRMATTLKHPNHSTLQSLCQNHPDQMKNFKWISLGPYLNQKAMVTRNSGSEKILKLKKN